MLAGRVAKGAALLEDPSAGLDRIAIGRRRRAQEARGRDDRRTEDRETHEGREATHHGTTAARAL
jgi:hypothetical protein